MKQLYVFLALVLFAFSCSSVSTKRFRRDFIKAEQQFQDHIGFVLFDPEEDKVIIDYQGDRYFTPASNTKIFTLYTSLLTLRDSIPSLKFIERGDSLVFWGTGDPSFLYKNTFTNDRVYKFLSSHPKSLYFSPSNFFTTNWGSGWAWDDYTSYYSAERSPFPIYGNIAVVSYLNRALNVQPAILKDSFTLSTPTEETRIVRGLETNQFSIHPDREKNMEVWDIPFHADAATMSTLLSDTLHRKVEVVDEPIPLDARTFYSIPSDSLYKVMMQESDNFVAEQLLLLCAQELSDSLQTEIPIKMMKQKFLQDLPDKIEWVDGSGLSRYNLFTPRSVVEVWKKIFQLVPSERLFPLLATGGKSGTIRNWYKADKPFIYGKTGSLSNNHCLSGYLITKRNKTYIFSFMNSNFVSPTSAVRQNMQNFLKSIYEKY